MPKFEARYGIIGYPAWHSLSPVMHNAAFKALGIKASYGIYEVPPKELYSFMDLGFWEEGLRGASVTIPHKVKIIEFLSEIDEVAEEIGAVNTILNHEGVLKGTNTDWYGILEPLKKAVDLKESHVMILGSGGSARAACYAMKKAEAYRVTVLGRRLDNARTLANRYDFEFDYLANSEGYEPDVVLQTTPIGMEDMENEIPEPDESPVPAGFFRKKMLVMDFIYRPYKTKFLRDAEKAGARIITGEKMLLHQGAKQFELWTGEKAPLKVMQAKLDEYLP